MKRKIFLTLTALVILVCAFSIIANASDTVSENYEIGDAAYTVYTEAQLVEVFDGVVDGTLENKTIVFGCDITMPNYDLYLDVACDVTIDLNGKTFTNEKRVGQTGDFHFSNKDAILRIKNGTIISNFCVFIFKDAGQVYAENVDVTSSEECIYGYDGPHGVLNFKNCNMKTTSPNYPAVVMNDGCGKDTGGETGGTRYEIEGGSYRGFNVYCANYGSYIKNCKIYVDENCDTSKVRLNLDTWCQHGKDGGVNEMIFENVDASGVPMNISDKRMTAAFYNCSTGTVTSVASGSKITLYTSPNCTEAGTKTVYTTTTGAVDEQYSIDNPATGHKADLTNVLSAVYSNGFDNKGKYVCSCAVCDVTDATAEAEAPKLFECLGYSAPDDGRDGIVIGFTVNDEAIKEYERITKKTLTYGVFAVLKDKLGTNNIFDENGKAADNVVNAEIDSHTYKSFEFKIVGFTDEHKDLKLAMGAYVVETDGKTATYSYLQCGKANDGEKYAFTSYYDAILNPPATDEIQ